jgi:hypothetical protein
MSAVTRPSGPLPARVYWVRRIVVLGVALLLVVGVARLLGNGSDASSRDSARLSSDQRDSSAAATDPTTAATTTAPVKPRVTKKARPTRQPLAQPSGPCDTEQLTVEPLVDRVTGGSPIRIPFRVLTDEPACTFLFSPNQVAVKIVSGKDLIWTSQQCPSLPTTDLVVRAEKPAKASMRWTGRRSNEGCKVKEAGWAEAGWYHVVAAALGGEPTDQQFRIVNPTSKTITKAPEPRQQQKKENGSQPTDERADGPRSGATEPS